MSNTWFTLGLTIANNERAKADEEARKAEEALGRVKRLETEKALKDGVNANSPKEVFDGNGLVAELGKEARIRGEIIKRQEAQISELEKSCLDKNALILDWMASNEGFKRLAKNYAKRLNISDEQFKDELSQNVIDYCEEDPRFQKTSVKEAATKRLSKK